MQRALSLLDQVSDSTDHPLPKRACATVDLVFVPRDSARFVAGETPVLVIGGAPIHAVLPTLAVSDGVVSACEGWTLLPQLTVCVVDGPGDVGCLIQAATGSQDVDEVATWCDAVDAAGGAVVVSLPDLPVSLDWDAIFSAGFARGGSIRTAHVE
ncbi:hypothetical protein ACFXPR_36070 [Nocardia tengchongensis]|uniref:hypothetical protein n=1 Tax=Nocardia tengchongensis TaxID=2055889 RepID=UPI00368D350C